MKRRLLPVLVAAVAVFALLPASSAQSAGNFTVDDVVANLSSPDGNTSRFMTFNAQVSPNPLTSYVLFWIDLPASQLNNPSASFSCAVPGSPKTCKFMGRDDSVPYLLGAQYRGAGGNHVATVQVWASNTLFTDFSGQDSNSIHISSN